MFGTPSSTTYALSISCTGPVKRGLSMKLCSLGSLCFTEIQMPKADPCNSVGDNLSLSQARKKNHKDSEKQEGVVSDPKHSVCLPFQAKRWKSLLLQVLIKASTEISCRHHAREFHQGAHGTLQLQRKNSIVPSCHDSSFTDVIK